MATKTIVTTKDAGMVRELSGASLGWNGNDQHLQLGRAGDGRVWRQMIWFNIDFTDIAILNSATLYLQSCKSTPHIHNWQTSAPSIIKIARSISDFGEGLVVIPEDTWEPKPPQQWDWATRFDKFSTTNEYTDNAFTQGADGTWHAFPVTAIVQTWLNGSVSNKGFHLRLDGSQDETASKSLLFYSRNEGVNPGEGSGPSSPYLVIDYDADVAPNAPINMAPTGDLVVNTLTPQLSFTFSDADSNDYMAGWNIEVYDDAVTDPATATEAQKFWITGSQSTTGTPQSLSVTYGNSVGAIIFKPLVAGAFYKWRAKTKDKTGKWGAFTSLHRFKVNATPLTPDVSVSPTPLSDVPDDTPNIFVIHRDPDPADAYMHAYEIRVEGETSPGAGGWESVWSSGQVDTSGAPVASVVVTTGTIPWGKSCRVSARTKDSSGAWSSFSAWLPFTVHKTAVASQVAPTGGNGVSATPTLTGRRGSGVDTLNAYSIRVFTDNLATTMLAETRYTTGITGGEVFSRAYAGAALTPGQYYQWQVKLESSIGGVGDWSPLHRFFVVDATTPSIIAPVGDNAYSLTPTVTIDRAGTFNRVEFEIYNAPLAVLGTLHYASPTISTSIGAGGLGTRYSATYSGTALTWDTDYMIRARVSSDGGSNWSSWSGYSWFKTGSAGAPTLTSVAGDSTSLPWVTDSTPDFVITRSGSDTIDWAQVRVYNETGSVLMWDSGLINVTNATTATITYAGPELIGGFTYSWDARYQSTAGATGPYASRKQFRLNRGPWEPSNLFPAPGHIFDENDTKTFQAEFSDADVVGFNDFPNNWEIEVQEINETPHDTENITTSLLVGLNSRTWPGTAFTTGVEYRWRTRFRDSKNVQGAYSGWNAFKVSTPPNGTITAPSNGSNVSTVTPTVSWTYSGGTQSHFTIRIDEAESDGTSIRTVTTLGPIFGTSTSHPISAGHLQDLKYYNLTLTVWNTDGLSDPSPSTVTVRVLLDAPNPITGLTPTTFDTTKVLLEWDVNSLKVGHTFIGYRVYRRLPNDSNWEFVGTSPSRNQPFYEDWYAGNTIRYFYRVVSVTTKSGVGIEMESPDDPSGGSFAEVQVDNDNWTFIGKDRDEDHIYNLIVIDENHNRPIQQEVFETLGSSRKVIMRGFVLGHEGSITTFWQNRDVQLPSDVQVFVNETILGRRIVDYLTYDAGPHIVKSPFGDVWESQFASPEYQWVPGGSLEVTLEFIETGNTSRAGSI